VSLSGLVNFDADSSQSSGNVDTISVCVKINALDTCGSQSRCIGLCILDIAEEHCRNLTLEQSPEASYRVRHAEAGEGGRQCRRQHAAGSIPYGFHVSALAWLHDKQIHDSATSIKGREHQRPAPGATKEASPIRRGQRYTEGRGQEAGSIRIQ
jgi:hypothetical protein